MADRRFRLADVLGQKAWDIPRYATVDVLVVGGGSAGATAAIAAARYGCKVLLVERYGFLGGIGTGVLDTFYGFYTPGVNRRVVGGIGAEIVSHLVSRDAAFIRPNTYGAGGGVTYCPETLKAVWDDVVLATETTVLFHCFGTDLVTSPDGRTVDTVIFDGKAGLFRVDALQVVDATGDADVAVLAGAGFEYPVGSKMLQPLTTTFRIANVDTDAARSFPKEELFSKMADAAESGAYRLPRLEGSIHRTPVEGVSLANMTRIDGIDVTDRASLSAAEVEGRRQVSEYVRFLRERVPGYGDARLIATSVQVGIRESRRVIGDYQLTVDDVLGARKFSDVIAQCGAPIEDHAAGNKTKWVYVPDNGVYDIPFRCLLPAGLDNVVVAGRCLSATHDAHASCRSIAQCMAMGQAAGTAAALAVTLGVPPRAVPINVLQERLLSAGAVLAAAQHEELMVPQEGREPLSRGFRLPQPVTSPGPTS
jgi:hypothetical protein